MLQFLTWTLFKPCRIPAVSGLVTFVLPKTMHLLLPELPERPVARCRLIAPLGNPIDARPHKH